MESAAKTPHTSTGCSRAPAQRASGVGAACAVGPPDAVWAAAAAALVSWGSAGALCGAAAAPPAAGGPELGWLLPMRRRGNC